MEVSEPFTKIVPSLTNNIPINPPSLSGIVQDNQLSSFLIYLPASYKVKTWQNRPKNPGFVADITATYAVYTAYIDIPNSMAYSKALINFFIRCFDLNI
jgi:hypothetical protein